jgi:hypothetical protein
VGNKSCTQLGHMSEELKLRTAQGTVIDIDQLWHRSNHRPAVRFENL